jgi:hypothetical protein
VGFDHPPQQFARIRVVFGCGPDLVAGAATRRVPVAIDQHPVAAMHDGLAIVTAPNDGLAELHLRAEQFLIGTGLDQRAGNIVDTEIGDAPRLSTLAIIEVLFDSVVPTQPFASGSD